MSDLDWAVFYAGRVVELCAYLVGSLAMIAFAVAIAVGIFRFIRDEASE